MRAPLISLVGLLACTHSERSVRIAPASADSPPDIEDTTVETGDTDREDTSVEPEVIHFAAIGDYGNGGSAETDVAELVAGWNPDFVITLGDNNYDSGSASTIDLHIGRDWHAYIGGYDGAYGEGSEENRFFPCLGNHDWASGTVQPYLDFFELPGNERYYSFSKGPIDFFVLDSDEHEPDGRESTSLQAEWLQQELEASDAPFQVVYFHHAPYTSGSHTSNTYLQWPFAEWGVDVVLSGHDHTYERLEVDGIPYFVNGLGGAGRYPFETVLPESQFRYNDDHGAQRVTASNTGIRLEFVNRAGDVIETYVVGEDPG